MNPYWGKTFFEVLALLGKRLLNLSLFSSLASDELQLLILIGASVALGIVGSLIVVNRMSMMANSLSHTVLLGIVLVYVLFFKGIEDIGKLGIMPLFIAALLSGLMTVSLSFCLKRFAKLQEDASIGLAFTFLFALSVILVSCLTRSVHIGIDAVMGNIEASSLQDVKLLFIVAALSIGFVTLFYHPLLAMSFDPLFSKFSLLHPSCMLYALLLLCSISVTSSFKAIGVILVLSLLTAPSLMAKLFVKKLSTLLIASCGIGIVCSLITVALSRHLLSVYSQPLSTSGLFVTLLSLSYFFLLFFKRVRSKQKSALC